MNTKIDLKDSDIREFAKSKIESARQEIKRWQLVLEALGEVKDGSQLSFLPPPSAKPSQMKDKQTKLSILEKVLNVLHQVNCPLTTRDIMESINTLYPDRIYDMGSFSGAFSLVYRKPNSGIRVYKLRKTSVAIKALYGLNEWFEENGKLKKEYENRVLDRYSVI